MKSAQPTVRAPRKTKATLSVPTTVEVAPVPTVEVAPVEVAPVPSVEATPVPATVEATPAKDTKPRAKKNVALVAVVEPVAVSEPAVASTVVATEVATEPVAPVKRARKAVKATPVVQGEQEEQAVPKVTKPRVKKVKAPVQEDEAATFPKVKRGRADPAVPRVPRVKREKVFAEDGTEIKPVRKYVKKVVPVVEGEEQVAQKGGEYRFFSMNYGGGEQGKYRGKKPKQAGNKAFSAIIKENKKNNTSIVGTDVNFTITEVSKNRDPRVYTYVGRRTELPVPITVELKIKDKETKEVKEIKKVVYKFKNTLKKARVVQVPVENMENVVV